MTDARSKLTVQILQMNPRAYEALVVESTTPAGAREQLADVLPEQLLGVPCTSPIAAYAMLAGLWLWNGGLNECHEIAQKSPERLLATALNLHRKPSTSSLNVLSAQSVENQKANEMPYLQEMESTLSFWHGIMHRQEGDFGNAKYWYAKVRGHPILTSLGLQAAGVVAHAPADKALIRLSNGPWDGAAFVDFVQQVHESPSDERYSIAVALQQLEWRVLFDYCTRTAAGI